MFHQTELKIMENKANVKSRQEKRKEARTSKNQMKFQSWIEDQKSKKMKKKSWGSESKNGKNTKKSFAKFSENRTDSKPIGNRDSDRSSEKPVLVKKLDFKLNSSGDGNSFVSVLAKRKNGLERNPKTKFEEYLKLTMQGNSVSAEEDLKFERQLAKKLKVKKSKLRGEDDGINMLFEGIPSVIDSFEEDEIPDVEELALKKSSEHKFPIEKKKISDQGPESERDFDMEAGEYVVVAAAHDSVVVLEEETVKASSGKKRRRRKLSNQGSVGGTTGEDGVGVSSEICGADVALEEAHSKLPAMEGNVAYVAPHLRSRSRNESEEFTQFRRRVRGLLNRLSESNVESITAEISSIFRSVARSVASQIISEEVLSSCSGGPRGNEQYAAVFAALVAGMACLVGIDFSAKLIASLARTFEEEYAKNDNISLRNLTLLLSYLCIFEVCSSDLIYDFLIMLSKRLLEIDVSTILTILQCCGMKLRGDDPATMKNFILSVQNRVNELKAAGDGQAKIDNKRMEFMLETICDIKNNKKRAKDDPAQHTRIKKWLQKLKAEDILIRGLTWSKLLDPDKKGQWWLSGDTTSITNNVEEVAGTIDKEILETQKMLLLAAKQRMNTDARKGIFCIIMSGEDYLDAFEKLLRLDLSGKQDREIMRVLVDCCLQERVFNKYYTVLASKLCNHDKNHKFTLQYCLWDHFKELESMQTIRSMHLARFFAEMLASFTLSLAVLKIVEFTNTTQLTPRRIMHFRMLFEAIFENSDGLVWNIFTRAAVTPELESLRNGIEFFIKEYVVGSNKAAAKKFKIAKKALNNVEGVLM